jgi:hypothetical protein
MRIAVINEFSHALGNEKLAWMIFVTLPSGLSEIVDGQTASL